MISRRKFIGATSAALTALPLIGWRTAYSAPDLPKVITDSKAQFYNGLIAFLSGSGANLAANQNLVLTNTVYPFDIDADSPYFNQELFRIYADRSFSGGIETGVQPNPQGYLAGRVSFQYRNLMDIVRSHIDTKHSDLAKALEKLEEKLDKANANYEKKVGKLDSDWELRAANRGLVQGTPAYDAEFIAWAASVSYADQQEYYSSKISDILSEMNAERRKHYADWEIAVLDNYENLGAANHIVRPWYAYTEKSLAASGDKLDDTKLANPRRYTPALYDRSPLNAPAGDFDNFLSGNSNFSFGTTKTSSTLSEGTNSWHASGGIRFGFWGASGGGSGSSAFYNTAQHVESFEVSFAGLSEYLVERGRWYNPAVFLDKNVEKIIAKRAERNYLQYTAVSLIVGRGTTLRVKFSNTTHDEAWWKNEVKGSAGVSVFGFSFGAKGGNSSTKHDVKLSTDGLTVTMYDEPNVARVLGARVEPFLTPIPKPGPTPLMIDTKKLKFTWEDVRRGKISYHEFIAARNAAVKIE